MGTKTNLDWLNNNSLLDGGPMGFQNIQGPVMPEHLPMNNATQPNYITNTSTNNNSISTNQVLGTVSGGAQMLNNWFGNLDKPIEDATTSNNTVNGYGYTSINQINQPGMGSGAFGSTLSGATSGAQAGMSFGPLGAAIGGGIGAIGGFVSNLLGNKHRAQQIDKQNTINTEKTGYNRSQANTNYLKQQYTQNSTFADGGMYLSTMITDMMAKMRNHDINNHNLNNFFTGGMFKGTQLDPESLTDRLIRNKYVKGGLVRYTPIEQRDTDNSYNKPSKLHGREYSQDIVPQLANSNAFNTPNAWVNKKETIMSQNGNVDSVDDNNPNMLRIHNGEDGYLASLNEGDMILSNNIKVPGTNQTFAQKGKVLENLINKAKQPTYNNVSENTNKLNATNAMNEYRQLFELQQQQKFNK